MREPGSWSREEGRRVLRELFFRTLRRDPVTPLVALLLLILAFSIVPIFVGYLGLRDFSWAGVGAATASAVWVMYLMFERESGASSRFAGADAEESSAEEFGKLADHHVVHGLEFDGRDVDHIIVGPSGIFAVETKWCGWPVIDGRGQPNETLRRFLRSAHWAAGRVDSLVRKSARLDVQVQPVLALWGPAAPREVGDALEVDEVLVLIGREASTWRSVFQAQRLDPPVVEKAWAVVTAQQKRQQRDSAAAGPKLRPWRR